MIKLPLKYFVELTSNPVTSFLLRTFTKSRISKPIIKPFVNTYGIQKEEMKYPMEHYKNLHALFTRELAPGIRPIDPSPETITSPVDGIVNDMGVISTEQTFYIKDQLYHLDEMLGDRKRAKKYQNGYFFILYLSPKHYHRIHYPIKGELGLRYALGEKSYPVNNLGTQWGDSPFSTNYRIISETTTAFGEVGIVKVGALNINSIQLTNSASSFKKGDEIGYFSFGSTVILLLENNPLFTPIVDLNTEVIMGQPIGRWIQ